MNASELARQLKHVGDPIVVATHPRSGTHLMIDLLRWQFRACRSWKWPGQRYNHLYLNLDRLLPIQGTPLDDRAALSMVAKMRRPVLKTHGLPDLAPWKEHRAVWADWVHQRGKFITVARDGRDVMGSYYLSHLRGRERSDTGLGPFLRETRHGYYVPGALENLNRVKLWAYHVDRWRHKTGVLALRYDAITTQPAEVVQQLAAFLDLKPDNRQPLLPPRFTSLWQSRLSRFFSWRPASSALIAPTHQREKYHWSKSFSEADRRFFDTEGGAVLRSLGYVKSDAWVWEETAS